MVIPGGSVMKNPPAMQETWVQSLGWKDPLEKNMATHSSILPGESHGQRSLASYSPFGHKTVGNNLAAKQQQQPIRPRQHFTEFRVYTRRGSRKVEQDSTFFWHTDHPVSQINQLWNTVIYYIFLNLNISMFQKEVYINWPNTSLFHSRKGC